MSKKKPILMITIGKFGITFPTIQFFGQFLCVSPFYADSALQHGLKHFGSIEAE